jgi:hypothetical protein
MVLMVVDGKVDAGKRLLETRNRPEKLYLTFIEGGDI